LGDRAVCSGSIAETFKATGRAAGEGGQAVAEFGAGHPQRTMLLAWHLWELTELGTSGSLELAQQALTDAVTDHRAELDAIWQTLTTVEQRVAVAVAHGLAPSGSRAQRATGIRNRSAAGRAANTLLKRGRLTREDGHTIRLVDPLLATYPRAQHPISQT
jgi:uncharacterized protein